MDVYNSKQVPSKTQIKKYIRRIVFGKNIFCPVCRNQKTLIRVRVKFKRRNISYSKHKT